MKKYFSRLEMTLWGVSVMLIVASFVIFEGNGILTLCASIIGVTSLIFNAKGNPIGQALMVVFCILYGIISFTFAYYGEMITYMGMTAPMAVIALIAWLKNPYNGNKSEVRVNRLKKKDIVFIVVLTAVVTLVFYFILDFFHTANIIPSTISVMTSFLAVYLTYKRSAFFALAYAANDIVLIILWIMAALAETAYVSVIVCFAMFFVNDIYGFINWSKMQKRQANKK
ncbi:MAG: nicotinamide mononucleotide transporter [Clostridia bacterium]|nr:nicotinamide mononucleotide transporter [Clostridia bacterium]